MSSTEKQLLDGTDTVRALRAKGGLKNKVCGLSANDLEQSFIRAGADCFLLKPIPCERSTLEGVLLTASCAVTDALFRATEDALKFGLQLLEAQAVADFGSKVRQEE
jgi:CheY-like chemotaxis protein